MRKTILILILTISILGLVVLFLRFGIGGDEDTWLCQNGQWVKHGKPLASEPVRGCGKIETENIKIDNPESDQIISFPLIIKGQARGSWYFEASFPIKLLDKNQKELAVTIAEAQADWMTNDFVPFKAVIELSSLPKTSQGTLVLQKDNPSGLPENDEKIIMPIRFPGPDTITTIKTFFNNSNLDPEFSCNKVFPVERAISKTPASARAALESLLRGPSFKEQKEGFSTSINSGVKIQKLAIENGIAKVDFDSQLEFQVGGSCRVSAIRAQITQTLKQFPTVKEVIISINGQTEDILQP
ncbi:MAG: GerMN domain-containing protein [bacterium]|nr:GerMN domain-containing protein [bacterium]